MKGTIVMGMAASQARFLQLTARKSNVEYEGQQINQQRTTLSNQSANYYNQLMGMDVPTVPSSSDYTTTVYTFEDGSLSNTVTSLIAQADGTYLVSYLSSWTNDFTPVASGYATVTKNSSTGAYMVGATTLRTITSSIDGVDISDMTDEELLAYATDWMETDEVTGDSYLSTLTADQLADLLVEEYEYYNLLNEKYGDDSLGWYIRYTQNSSTGAYEPTFYRVSSVNDSDDGGSATYSSTGTSLSSIATYTIGSATETEEIKGVTARLEKDSTGRYTNITLYSDDESTSVTYSLTTNTATDDDAYNDAMNQYEYDKYLYDQSIQEINAKIEVVQAQDKTLELRLKQLDTEQNAIQTEMDAVEKVIEKNTESTFKTFG